MRHQIIWQMILGDFRERTRRYSFLLILLGTLFFGYLVVTGKYAVQFNEYRGETSSAWEGSLMALCGTMMLLFFGFYLVKNSIGGDRRSNVGQIIAATRIRNHDYILAKFASNFLVLAAMVCVLATAALLVVAFTGVEGGLDLWELFSPFLIIAIPAMLVVSAAAVFFESVRWLRGIIGNVVYLFLAEAVVVSGVLGARLLDITCADAFVKSAQAAAARAYPDADLGMQMGFIAFDDAIRHEVYKTFAWGGIEWTAELLLQRLLWIGAALVVAMLSPLFFDRFDPSARKRLSSRKRAGKPPPDLLPSDDTRREVISARQLVSPSRRFGPLGMLVAELRLMLKGHPWLWYLVAVGLIAAQIAAPFEIARVYIVSFSMVWPIRIWSSMGTREFTHNTAQLLFSSPYPVGRQLPTMWTAGILIGLMSVAGLAVRALGGGDWRFALALASGAFFVPSLALALGTVSRSNKLFEVSYLILWYVGTMDNIAALDFLGVSERAVAAGTPTIFLLVAAALSAAAFVARRAQIYHYR
jgi:hypothetical protein